VTRWERSLGQILPIGLAAMQRAQEIRQLVRDSQYVIDEQLVAAAVIARAQLRRTVADATFRNDVRAPRQPRAVRSFRPSKQARSFRPCTQRDSRDRRRVAVQLIHLGLI
jgi:hypothetical protein